MSQQTATLLTLHEAFVAMRKQVAAIRKDAVASGDKQRIEILNIELQRLLQPLMASATNPLRRTIMPFITTITILSSCAPDEVAIDVQQALHKVEEHIGTQGVGDPAVLDNTTVHTDVASDAHLAHTTMTKMLMSFAFNAGVSHFDAALGAWINTHGRSLPRAAVIELRDALRNADI